MATFTASKTRDVASERNMIDHHGRLCDPMLEAEDYTSNWKCERGSMMESDEAREVREYAEYQERQARYAKELEAGDVSIEQMVRNIIETAIADGIVTFNADNYDSTPTIQHMTSGDIVGPANVLAMYFGRRKHRSSKK